MDEIKTKLVQEITDELDDLQEIEIGTQEYKTTVEGITKLADKVIEMEKLEADALQKARSYELDKNKFNREMEERIKAREIEESTKKEQAKDNRKFKWLEIGIAVVGIAVPTIVKIWGTNKTLKFEETGTVTTMAGRSHINSLFTKK